MRQRTLGIRLKAIPQKKKVNEKLTMIALKAKQRPSMSYILIKRAMDICLSLLLLLLSLPLFILIALLIKLDSPGPIFFSHQRIGKAGKPFFIYKFRTMYAHTLPYAEAPLSLTDARITRIGRFLRRSSLDELPQLVNVILGEMSLVGPRPEMPFIVSGYTMLQRKRLQVLPGITGLWQVSGRNNLPLVDNIKYDLFYVRKQSLRLDLFILLKTIPAVISGKGAY